MTDPLGQSQVIPYLQGLSAAGHQVWLMSFEKPERYLQGKEFVSSLLKSSTIHWLPQLYRSKPPVISTLLDVRTMRKKAYECIQLNQIDVLHCRSYISALVGQSAKKKFGTRFIFDMRGFWADERVDGGIWNLKNPLFKTIYNFFKSKEKQFLLQADTTVSLTKNASAEIHSWKGFETIPIKVIPCCADLTLYKRPSDEAILAKRKELGISNDQFVLTYLGSLGTWYMLPEMILFFKVLLQTKPNARFLFITGDHPQMVTDEAKRQQIPEYHFIIQKSSRNEVPLWASIGNASIFFIKPLYSKKASSPTKMGELMALGMPIICNNRVGDVESILQDGGNGVIVKNFTSPDFETAIQQLNSVLIQNPENSIQCAYRHYSLSDGIDRYNGIYSQWIYS